MSDAIHKTIESLVKLKINTGRKGMMRTVKLFIRVFELRGVLVKDDVVYWTKRAQMYAGDAWQDYLAELSGSVSMRGDKSGLDLRHDEDKKFVMELKSSDDSDNASARKSNLDKLAKFKRNNPDYDAIYGVIRGKNCRKEILHNGVKLLLLSGDELTNYLCRKTVHEVESSFITEFKKMYLQDHGVKIEFEN